MVEMVRTFKVWDTKKRTAVGSYKYRDRAYKHWKRLVKSKGRKGIKLIEFWVRK